MFLLLLSAHAEVPSVSVGMMTEATKDADSRECYNHLREPYFDPSRHGLTQTETLTIIFSIRELAAQGGPSFKERCDESVRTRFPDADVIKPAAWPASRNSPTQTFASSPHAPPPGNYSDPTGDRIVMFIITSFLITLFLLVGILIGVMALTKLRSRTIE